MTQDVWDDEALMRRIDGELDEAEGALIDAAARTDPALAARLSRLRAMRTAAGEAFPVAADRRDEALVRLIADSGRPARSANGLAAALKDAFAPRRAAIWVGLAAAGFVGGLLLGPLLTGGTARGDAMTIGPDMARVLEIRLAEQGADAAGRRVGLTFRDDRGRWCRTFSDDDAGAAGLACRTTDGWIAQALVRSERRASDLRMASSDTPEAILAAVDATAAQPTLDVAAERAARDAGWR